MIDRKSRISYLVNIKKFISNLERITGKEVNREDIEAIDVAYTIRQKPAKYFDYPLNKLELSYSLIKLEILSAFFDRLYHSNNTPVYVWIDGVDECGLLKLPSIKSVNVSFFFDPGHIQVLTFTTVDSEDMLLLDIDLDDSNRPTMLTLEYQGKNWSSIEYG